MRIIKEPIAFQWDAGNQDKNYLKHKVTNEECETVFFDPHKRILADKLYSGREKRFILLGATEKERLLFIVFTLRIKKIRVISARDLNIKERRLYGQKT